MQSVSSFRFGDFTVKSLGVVEIHLEVPSHGHSIPVLMDIVPVYVPELLGLDVLDSENLYSDHVINSSVTQPYQSLEFEHVWSVTLTLYEGH